MNIKHFRNENITPTGAISLITETEEDNDGSLNITFAFAYQNKRLDKHFDKKIVNKLLRDRIKHEPAFCVVPKHVEKTSKTILTACFCAEIANGFVPSCKYDAMVCFLRGFIRELITIDYENGAFKNGK